ncbi:MAG: hypothetical protein GY940_06060, partial [bacterium]|nr:hypothetical protein [bacterium]
MSNRADGKICLYIEPYVHVNIKSKKILLYNTLTGEQLVYDDSPAIAALLGRMMSRENLNVIIEENTVLEEENLHGFLEKCRSMQLINWYGYSKEGTDHKKPVSLPAILNFHRDREKMALDPERDPGQDIINYLHKLNIYINSYHGGHYNVPLFREGYKQFLFPYWTKQYNELELSAVERFLDQVKALGLCGLTVLGGNIFRYSELNDLTLFLAPLPLKTELGVFYKEIAMDNLERVDWHSSGDVSLKVFVEPQVDKNQLVKCIELLKT